jgi:hypothetical protein
MKVKDMIELLSKEDPNREVVLAHWDTTQEISQTVFYKLTPTCDPHANSKNILAFRTFGTVEHIKKDE